MIQAEKLGMIKGPVLPLSILILCTLLAYNNCAGPMPDLESSSSAFFSASGKQTLAFSEFTKIEAVNGTAPYVFEVVAPARGTITAAGIYTSPTTAGSDTIQITDANGAQVRIAITVVNGGTTGPGSCLLPWGGTVANAGTVTAYQAPTATCPAACVSQVRSCASGVLSGTYTSRSCGSTCPVATADTARVVSPSTSGNVLSNDSIPAGGGRVVKEPDFATYPAGQVVRMFAVPDGGYAFVRWEGAGIASTANPLTLTLTANVSVTAVFESGEVPLLAGTPVIAGGGEFRSTFTGPSASALVIEASSDLEVWLEIRRIEPFTGSYVLEIPEPVGAGRFFRARTIP